MKFLEFMIPGAYSTELGERVFDSKQIDPAAEKEMAKMGQFNDELEKAGARLTFAGGKAKATDGPFIETKEVVGGYWVLQAKSKQQVIDWMKRCPAQPDDVIEIRPIAEMSDFSRGCLDGACAQASSLPRHRRLQFLQLCLV